MSLLPSLFGLALSLDCGHFASLHACIDVRVGLGFATMVLMVWHALLMH